MHQRDDNKCLFSAAPRPLNPTPSQSERYVCKLFPLIHLYQEILTNFFHGYKFPHSHTDNDSKVERRPTNPTPQSAGGLPSSLIFYFFLVTKLCQDV